MEQTPSPVPSELAAAEASGSEAEAIGFLRRPCSAPPSWLPPHSPPPGQATLGDDEVDDEAKGIMAGMQIDADVESLLGKDGGSCDAELLQLAEKVEKQVEPSPAQSASGGASAKELEDAMESGLKLGSGLGQKFTREARLAKKEGNPEFDDYCGSNKGQADVHAMRVMKKYHDVVEGRADTQEWKRIDWTQVTYRNPDFILAEQGGKHSGAAVRATATLVRKCPLMGQPWWEKHPLTDRIEFANLVIGFDSSFSKSWAQFRQSRTRSSTGGSGGSDDDIKGQAAQRQGEGAARRQGEGR